MDKVEDLGFTGLYLSDDFVMIAPPDYPSLKLVVALTYLAYYTERVRFGPMVSPLSFRDPVTLARQAAAIDDLGGGRFEFGIGSGYFRMDYDWTGIPFDPPGERLSRFIEAVRLVKSAFTQETVDFLGEHYTVRGLSVNAEAGAATLAAPADWRWGSPSAGVRGTGGGHRWHQHQVNARGRVRLEEH